MSKEVWVIGVDPPCPRCDLMRQRVERLARETDSPVTVTDLVYSGSAARRFGETLGKELGTAKHVAQKAGIDMDWNQVSSVVKSPPSQPPDWEQLDGPARRWSPEMDQALRPCQEAAERVGMLMTPILVVGGEVKHHGSVPSLEQLRSWLC